MKTLIKILCLSVLWFSCEPIDEEVCITWIYDSDGNGYTECYSVQETTELVHTQDHYGEIPSEIQHLINLDYLYLSDNGITGEIPSWIGNLTKLTRLSLYKNNLTGEIPLSIGNLTNLNTIQLWNNQLTGVIPEEICNGDTTPDLNSNNFCPPYPDCGDGPITSESNQDTSNCP